MNWQALALVFFGSGLGGCFRYLIAQFHGKIDHSGLQHFIPILIVNVIGSFLIGIAFGFLQRNGLWNKYNLLLVTGFLGGFTTYSSFSLDLLKLVQRGEYSIFFLYILCTLFLGFIAVFIGFWLVK